jgi:hypothetical protein
LRSGRASVRVARIADRWLVIERSSERVGAPKTGRTRASVRAMPWRHGVDRGDAGVRVMDEWAERRERPSHNNETPTIRQRIVIMVESLILAQDQRWRRA